MKFNIFLITLLLMAVFLAGCSSVDVGDVKDKVSSWTNGMTEKVKGADKTSGLLLTDYLNGTVKAYRRVDNTTIQCISGTCASPDEGMDYFVDTQCSFCDSLVIEGNSLTTRSKAVMNWGDFTTACSEKHRFTLPFNFTIINKSNTTIFARGGGYGFVNKSGKGCSSEYAFNLKTEETWMFTINKPQVKIKVNSDGPLTSRAFRVEGNKLIVAYSKNGLTVTCDSPYFKVRPGVKLINYNGYNATKERRLLITKKYPESYYANPAKFVFSSSYNGEFEIQPVCEVIGRSSNTISVIKSPKMYKLVVSGSDKGYYKELN